MKNIILLSAFLFLASCISKNTRGPSSTESQPKHYVITLHGVRGNSESFGDFHQIVKTNLEKIDSRFQVQVFNWTYPVGAKVEDSEKNITWSPHLIAKKFNQDFFLSSQPLIPEMGPQDKISLIAYSMGGLMAMTWYYDTMFNFMNHPELAYSQQDYSLLQNRLAKVENMIGLGAVYWGSLDAEFGWSFLENGDLSEVRNSWPKLRQMCESPAMKNLMAGQSLIKNMTSRVTGQDNQLSIQEKNEKFVKSSVVAACESVKWLGENQFTSRMKTVSSPVLSGLKKVLTSAGNVSMQEINNMRVTSDVINEMRIGRMRHVLTPELRERFKAKWSSIVGVFPCLGKKDSGVTCKEFKSEDFKKVNESLLSIFSGVYRRETDGPVMSPGAAADFLFYTELKGKENQSIRYEEFMNTQDLQKISHVNNREIFVENMHATVIPALESITGALKSVGQSGAQAMREFDQSLGTDVVIVNKECADPKQCTHPNYKHILQELARCESSENNCDQEILNQYYQVSKIEERNADSQLLKDEMGGFALVLNIRLPAGYRFDAAMKAKLLSYFQFTMTNQGTGDWDTNRLDMTSSPYAAQIARPNEILSSYAYLQRYQDSSVLRVFFVGRAWAKKGQEAAAQVALNGGIPVRFDVRIPGVQSRRVVAKVKPTYTTYVDMFMK